MSWPSRVSQEIQRIKKDHRQQIKMKSVMLVVFATCFGTEARGAWGKCGVMAVSSLSVIQAKWDCRYEKGRNCSDDMMRDTRVTQSPSSFSAARPINSVTSSVCVFVCANIPLSRFLSGLCPCVMWCSHSGGLSTTPIKREGCPLPYTLRHASPASRERGPIIYYLFPSC